jgi:hypothetical protein
MHIYANGEHKLLEKDIIVTHVEELNKSADLSTIAEFQVRVHDDNIELYKKEKESPIVLRHPDNIATIQQALFSGKSFIIDFMENNRVTQGQVKDYSNGYRLRWNNYSNGLRLQYNSLISSYDLKNFDPLNLDCFKTIIPLEDNNKPRIISLDLDKEEKPQSYQLKKLMGGGLLAAVLAVVIYQLKDKFYTLGDLLLQQTKAITNIESSNVIGLLE